MSSCPPSAELTLAALGDPRASVDARLAKHMRHCAACRGTLAVQREIVRTLRTTAPARIAGDSCLDPHDLAHLLDGPAPEADAPLLGHLAACARCRAELSTLARLVRGGPVAAELDRLESPSRHVALRPSRMALAGLAAAAAVVALIARPPDTWFTPVQQADTYRERTITTTAAPRIVGPVEATTVTDSLTWTGVPGADFYRVTFWRPDGSVEWNGDTRDTVIAFPGSLLEAGVRSLLCDVKARTGWDRWVVSEMAEITVSVSGGSRQ